MTDIAAGKQEAHQTGLVATISHMRYVLGEDRVTAFASLSASERFLTGLLMVLEPSLLSCLLPSGL